MFNDLETFNRHVAHDLRGPIGSIGQLARLATEALSRGDQSFVARALPVIAAQADDAVELLSAMLMLADDANASLPMERVAAGAVVQAALDALPASSARSHCRLVVGPLPEVRAHAALLRQVFVNLLGNAMKFSQGRGRAVVLVGASTSRFEHVFRVRDYGVGFDPQSAQRLFLPFQRLHGAAFAGHGLGLSIARSIVERHGGRIWCHSQPGKGTTMLFAIPRRETD